MATKTNPDQDKYNPAASDADRKFGGDQMPDAVRSHEKSGVASQKDIDGAQQGFYKPGGDLDSAKAGARKGEKQAISDSAAGKAATLALAGANPALGTAAKFLGKIKTRKGSAASAIVVTVIVFLVIMASLFGASLGPIAFFTNVMDDLNDSVAALDERNGHMFGHKVPFREESQLLKGCKSKMSIRCKYRSLSDKDVERLSKADIEVEGRVVGKRTFPDGYRVSGGELLNPREFANQARTDPKVRTQLRQAFNMRFLSTVSANFKSLLARFGTSAKAATVTGDTEEERFNNLATNGARPEVDLDSRFIIYTDADGEPIKDADGNNQYVIDGDDSGRVYSEADKTRHEGMADTVKGIGKPGAKMAILRSLSITGWADTACSFKNTIGLTAMFAKVFQKRHLIKAAMPIASLAFKIKAGHATPQDAAAIGEYFSRKDVRQEILDVGATVENSNFDSSGNLVDEASVQEHYKDNPFYGKNALDANLSKLSLHGGDYQPTETSVKYSLSMSDSLLVGGMAGFASVLTTITSIGSDTDTCDYVQSWWARGLGLVAGIFAMFGTVGTSVAFNATVMAAALIGSMIMQEMLMNMVAGSVIPEDIADKPEDRAAIQWTGTAAIMDEAAKRNGLIPGSKAEVLAYQQRSLKTRNEYIAMEAENVAWNDRTSPYSLISRVAIMADQYRPGSLTLPAAVGSVKSLIAGATTNATAPNTYARTIDEDRLEHCDDEQYDEAGIAADVQCNIRYQMPAEDMALDADEVAVYMEEEGYVETDTVTGMPDGYTPPDDSGANGFLESIASGAVNEFYNTRSSMYDGNKYAVYLDYCVYRVMPWGETYEENSAFGSVSDGWIDGTNCMTRAGDSADDGTSGEAIQRFRIYTLDRSTVEIGDEYTQTPSYPSDPGGPVDGQPPDTERVGSGWQLKDDVDYTSYPCAEGTTDIGIYEHPTRGFTIRRCSVGAGDDVASIISSRAVALLNAAEQAGVTGMSVYSGFRSYEEQQRLYNQNCRGGACDPPTAVPGSPSSNHEQGIAIDFAHNGQTICFGRATCNPGENPVYEFLMDNAGKYGFLKHTREAWHWGMRTY